MAMRSEAEAIPGVGISWRQLAGYAGIIGVILFVIGFVLQADYPTVTDDVSDVTAYFEDNGTRFLVGNYLISIGIVFFLVPFFLGLRSVLAEAEGGHAHWAQVGFFGSAMFVILGGAFSTFSSVLALGIKEIDNDATVRALQYADLYAFSLIVLAPALYFVATGLVILRTGVFWSWLGGIQLILAVLAVIGAANSIDGDPEGVLAIFQWISFIGFGVVILLQSAGLLTKKSAV